ncbi:MAG: DUF58 domain-containing protein [Victivallaceae bacterium]
MILIMPTYRGVIFSFAALGSIAIALVNTGLATALTASCLVGFVASSFILAMFSLFSLELNRRANRDSVKGEKLQLPLSITNHSFRYRQSLIIREKCPFTSGGVFNYPVPPLAPGEEMVLDRLIPATKRGHYKLNRITLIGGDPAGLFYQTRHFNRPTEVMIFPETVNTSWLPLRLKHKSMPETEGRPLGLSGQGQEFFGIRNYRHSDEFRFIHWKATAAKKKLMVKEFEANTVDQVTILLDTFTKDIGLDQIDDNFEFMIKTAATICSYLAEMYCRLQFFTVGIDNRIIHLSGDSVSIKNKIITSLATLKDGSMPLDELLGHTLDRIHPNSIFYCLTLSEPESLQKNFEALLEQDIDVRWIYAPKQYFPIIDPEKPRIIHKGKVKVHEQIGITPYIATFKTDVAAMLRND